MTAKSWEPLVYEDKSGGYYYAFEGTFYGNDHTIRIKGGLVGYNNGDVKHCTFYGEVDCNHDNEDSKYIGDQSENADKLYDSFNQDEYNDASSYALYRYAMKYPYAINVSTNGLGTAQLSAGGETGITRWRPSSTVTLTAATGTIESIIVTDAGGSSVTVSDYTFTMPKRDVNVNVVFTTPAWLNHAGTEDDPVSIGSVADWNEFAQFVNGGNSFSGKVVKLNANIDVTTTVGLRNEKPFSGTFDGDGHTMTANISISGTMPSMRAKALPKCGTTCRAASSSASPRAQAYIYI